METAFFSTDVPERAGTGSRIPLRILEYSQRYHSPVAGSCRSFMGRGESAPAVFRNSRRYPGSMS